MFSNLCRKVTSPADYHCKKLANIDHVNSRLGYHTEESHKGFFAGFTK